MSTNDSNIMHVTLVPDIFIDTYMVEANGEYVKVYLYILRHQPEKITIGGIADALNYTEADVQRALKYWRKAGVLAAEPKPEEKTQMQPVSSTTTSATSSFDENAGRDKTSRTTTDESFKQIIYVAQTYLNKQLTLAEFRILENLYSNLEFSEELLEYLIEYCVQNNHANLRYMEKVALSWHEYGIKDVEQAKAKTENYTNGTYAVMRTMGLTNRKPAEIEMAYIKKWHTEYGFTQKLIIEACSRTIRQICKPSFDYADKILRDWKSAGVKSIQDIEALDKKRKEENEEKRQQVSVNKTTCNRRNRNRFHNFEEHGYDYEKMLYEMMGWCQK